MTSISVADALFTKTQQQVLGLLYGHPENSFYTNDIVRRLGMGRGTVRRELERLVSAGILMMSAEGNRHHYRANSDCPVYPELVGLTEKLFSHARMQRKAKSTPEKKDRFSEKSIRIGSNLSVPLTALRALARRYHIRRLALFGSAARGELKAGSDIDLLVEFDKKKAPSLWTAQAMQDDFSHLFGGRAVDILPPEILRNPFRKKTIEKDLKVLYESD
jgi:predicted nucleotidyltransferase